MIHHIDWDPDGARVHIEHSEPEGIGVKAMQVVRKEIHRLRHDAQAMTEAERRQIGPEVILLLRDVAPHLLCSPIEEVGP